jgi:protein gp37
MGENSAIEWTTHTWNPWLGCTEVSPGCDHCYARELARRYGWASWGKGAERHRTSAATWRQPVLWNRKAATSGDRVFVFCASLADFFDPEVPDDWRRDAWDVVRQTPWLTWQILTKRPNLIPRFLPPDWFEGWPHVWLGTSVEDQRNTWRIDKLVQVPAAVRFLSCEPLLGPVQIPRGIRGVIQRGPSPVDAWNAIFGANDAYAGGTPLMPMPNLLHWVICGGESGPHARPMHPDWARSLRDQCVAAGVPFLFKQWGNLISIHGGPVVGAHQHPLHHWRLDWDDDREDPRRYRVVAMMGPDGTTRGDTQVTDMFWNVGKRAAGRLLDGIEHNAMPEVRHAR